MLRRLAALVPPAVALGLVFWLGVAALLASMLARERHNAVLQARQEVATLSAVMEENTARTFDGVDVALAGVAGMLGTRAWPPEDEWMRTQMRARLKFLPTVRAMFVIGPDGWIRHDTDFPNTPRVSLADRPYFQQYLADPALERALSPALQSRSGTGWFVASTRRVTAPDGSFGGVVVAAVQLDWISRLFTQLQLQPGQTIALFQSDGRLLARYPRDDARVNRMYAQQSLFAQHLPRSRAGVYETDGPPLGYERIVAYRALETQPLVVVLTTPMSTVLAAWNRTAGAAGVLLALLALLTATGVFFYRQRQVESGRAVAHRVAQAEAQAAAEANAKFRTFFEQGGFFSCVLSLDGTVLEANDAVVAACGVPRAELMGRKFWEGGWWGAGPAHAQRVRDAVAAAAAGRTVRSEAAYRLADGSQRLLELGLSPIRDTSGAVLSIAALGVDITQRKHQEERLRALADELTSADRLKGEFLATLSHELRNVLAPLQNGLGILQRVEPGSARALRAQEMVARQIQQMRGLVDDLLDISRVNSGKVRVEKAVVDLRELLAQAADAARTLMDGPGHRFTTAWAEGPLPVEVDRTRILQVLDNLLGNAAKYTPPGGNIQLNARREGAEIVVEVVDDGMGIPLDAQVKIFDMFQQVRQHLERAQGGLGIGLSLVQKLVALHGGHVEAFSAGPGRGSTFTVYLPAADGAGAGQLPGAGHDAADPPDTARADPEPL